MTYKDDEGSLDGVMYDGYMIEEIDKMVRVTTPLGEVWTLDLQTCELGPQNPNLPKHVRQLVRAILTTS